MNYICVTCGTQFPENDAAADAPPARCPICEDDRQYVGHNGQQWTTMETLQADHSNEIRTVEANLTGVGTTPSFAIGQRALLVQTPGGNILWDCVSLLDSDTIDVLNALGGVAAIATSHPHFYASMIEWAHAFDAPVYLHEAERQWVMRPDDAVQFWRGESKHLWDDISLIRCGGHFPGAQVLHWPAGAEGRGVLLTGDVINVVADRRWVSFMYSFPNLIPLPAAEVRQVVAAVEPFQFDRIYSAWWGNVVAEDAKAAVQRSADRYVRAIRDE